MRSQYRNPMRAACALASGAALVALLGHATPARASSLIWHDYPIPLPSSNGYTCFVDGFTGLEEELVATTYTCSPSLWAYYNGTWTPIDDGGNYFQQLWWDSYNHGLWVSDGFGDLYKTGPSGWQNMTSNTPYCEGGRFALWQDPTSQRGQSFAVYNGLNDAWAITGENQDIRHFNVAANCWEWVGNGALSVGITVSGVTWATDWNDDTWKWNGSDFIYYYSNLITTGGAAVSATAVFYNQSDSFMLASTPAGGNVVLAHQDPAPQANQYLWYATEISPNVYQLHALSGILNPQ